MKSKFIILLSFILIIVLTGCDKYEKDVSLNTNLYGSYCKSTESTNTSYSMNEVCTFNPDNTYTYSVKEVVNSKTTKDNILSGNITVEEVSTDITKITKTHSGETYKYKNMLGNFYECTFPEGKTFNLKSDNFTFWFDEEGQYHLCTDTAKCDCITNCPQYIRKDDIIYFQSMSKEYKNTYSIGAYIVEQGIFFPELYKSIEN